MSDEVTRIEFSINGARMGADAEPRMLLADFIRHRLHLTGTHVGCAHGACGACTVMVNGRPARSCLMFAVQAQGAEVKTVEGMSSEEELSPLQQEFRNHHALQCGFCTPGMLISAQALLDENPQPTEEEIRKALAGNLCRCTGYNNIVRAVQAAAKRLNAD
ncbi:(2Fe-2S)-binding protein [Cupriavidus alkaliphilus]|uniref:(2Fe-2S)-binding protein n=1 Tax=Cupriavidus alkaliphilus TaxID=942866 RepID=UPI0016228AB8|nr:(2Fe-2S)-binding protein [Cupriavidus alkaliphilus]MBB3014176.1 aerobic-type carbon monoxide dehydrogenase small subunit (CoxS/CutS family) [Cupriavidus alkaliphilus]